MFNFFHFNKKPSLPKNELSKDELEQLPLAEFSKLSEDEKDRLVKNIISDRPRTTQQDIDSFCSSSKNVFLEQLIALLSTGKVSLIQFAKLDTNDQFAFITGKNDIILLLKHEITFDKITELHASGLRDVVEWLDRVNLCRVASIVIPNDQLNLVIEKAIFFNQSYTAITH